MRKQGFGRKAVLCILSIMFFTSCAEERCPPPSTAAPVISQVSKKINVNVFIDATPSMKGFVSYNNSNYIQLLRILNDTIVNGWENVQLQYLKFGSEGNNTLVFEEMKGSPYIAASNSDFYNDPRFNTTLIDQAINHEGNDNLRVIVTDLFQDQNDISRLTSEIRSKYFRKNLGMGLIGIKSGFKGIVYDVDGTSFQYDTKGNPDRPFYVLVFGKFEDINAFLKGIKERSDRAGINEYNSILLSPVNNVFLSSSEGKITNKSKGLNEKKSFEKTKGLQIRGTDPVNFKTELPYPHDTGLEIINFKIEAKLWGCQNNKMTPFEEMNSIKVTSSEISRKKNKLEINTEIKQKSFRNKRQYLIQYSLYPDEFDIPLWISAWDMNLDKSGGRVGNRANFDGSSTLRLKSFVFELSRILKLQKPKIGELNFYFIRNNLI